MAGCWGAIAVPVPSTSYERASAINIPVHGWESMPPAYPPYPTPPWRGGPVPPS